MKLQQIFENEFDNIEPTSYKDHVELLNDKITSLKKNHTHYKSLISAYGQNIINWMKNNGFQKINMSPKCLVIDHNNEPEIIEHNQQVSKLITKFDKIGILLRNAEQKLSRLTSKTTGKCAYQFIVMTGFRDAELDNYIQSNGGTVQSGVNGKTTILIAADPNKMSTKIQKAKSFGARIMSRTDFNAKYNKMLGYQNL